MTGQRAGFLVPIIVAIITVGGGIAVALITKGPFGGQGATQEAPATVNPIDPAPSPSPPLPVAITGVLIGKTGTDPFVSSVITRFAPSDEVAITVRYQAAEQVADFPVRLSARVFSGFGTEEQTTDVSRPGASFWTFRFKPKDGWISPQQFVSIEINGEKIYSQEFSIQE